MRLAAFLAVGLSTIPGALAVLPALLSAAGFTPAGIALGSWAAGAQSSIGNVPAGGWFATLQSAGMGGYGATVLNAASQAGAAGAAAGFAAGSKFHGDRRKAGEKQEEKDEEKEGSGKKHSRGNGMGE